MLRTQRQAHGRAHHSSSGSAKAEQQQQQQQRDKRGQLKPKEDYEKLVKQHFVALQALETLAWENEKLHQELDSAKQQTRRVEELEAALQAEKERSAAVVQKLRQTHEVTIKQIRLETQVKVSSQVAEAEERHEKQLQNICAENQALTQAAKQGFEEALDQLRAQVQEKALCIEQLQQQLTNRDQTNNMKHESQVDALNNAVKEREKLAALVEHERKIHSEDAQALRKERDRLIAEVVSLKQKGAAQSAATSAELIFERKTLSVAKAPERGKQRPASCSAVLAHTDERNSKDATPEKRKGETPRGGSAIGAMSLKVEHLLEQARLAEGRYQDVLKQNRQLKQLLLNNREAQRKLVGRTMSQSRGGAFGRSK
eukprot:INCI17512.4.p1 GENE.INCI17512.4~~INCI17512.4.p1  ORF type:complete len:371 (-),score=102.90 INCI17512.4:178-1290(-)